MTVKETDGLELRWGSADVVLALIRKIAHREGFGDVLADGAKGRSGQNGRLNFAGELAGRAGDPKKVGAADVGLPLVAKADCYLPSNNC